MEQNKNRKYTDIWYMDDIDDDPNRKVDYEEIRLDTDACMGSQPDFDCGENFIIYSETYYASVETTEAEWLGFFVSIALYELKRGKITDRAEAWATFYIYQYEHFGLYHDQFVGKDKELLEKDIAEIKSLMHLRFEDLECYEG